MTTAVATAMQEARFNTNSQSLLRARPLQKLISCRFVFKHVLWLSVSRMVNAMMHIEFLKSSLLRHRFSLSTRFVNAALASLLVLSCGSSGVAVDTKDGQSGLEQKSIADGVGLGAESSPEQIEKWISDLSSTSFKLRRESFVQLWRSGEPALKAVQAAMLSSDKQQAETAATLEVLIRLNVTFDDPVEAANLLSELSSTPELALVKLCKRGYWNVGEQLLQLNGELLNSFRSSASAYSRLNALVDEALDQDKLDLAWPVVRQVLPYQQALWIASRHNFDPPKVNLEDPAVQAWSLFLQGKYAEMLRVPAPVSQRAELAVRAFQWDAFQDPELLLGLIGRRRSAGQLAAQAVMLDFAGKQGESDAIWKTLLPQADFIEAAKDPAKAAIKGAAGDSTQDASKNGAEGAIPETEGSAEVDLKAQAEQLRADQIRTDRSVLDALDQLATDPTNLDRVFVGMLLSGRAQAVQDYLLEQKPEDAWTLCLIRGDQASALSAQGLAPDLSNFEVWLGNCRSNLHFSANQSPNDVGEFQTVVQLANDLQGLGMIEQADKLFEVLLSVCQVAKQSNDNYWQVLASNMTRAESRRRLLSLMADQEVKLGAGIRERILTILYPECAGTAPILFGEAPEIMDSANRPSKWEAIEQLYLFNRQAFEPQGTKTKTVSDWLRRVRARLSEGDELSSMQLGELAKLADGNGMADLALEFARESGQASIELWAYAGRILQERGDLKSAIEYYSAIRQMDGSRQEAIVDEANSQLMMGQVSEAIALQKSRWLRPLMIYGISSWFTVARRLNEAKRYELAKEYIEPSFMLAGCDAPENLMMQQPSFIGIALEYAQTADELKDVELSANLHRAILTTFLNVQKTRTIPANLYASLGAKERTRQAILAARRGDMEAFERHAKIAEDLQPQGIELVEDSYPDLVASGNQAVADAWLAKFEKRLLSHLERWPKDATTHNNLAWMYARCNVKLDEALEHSQLAVELSPYSATLLDTLAEVQFRLKQYSAAIDSMKRCILLDPRDPHMRRQLERFLKAEIESRR